MADVSRKRSSMQGGVLAEVAPWLFAAGLVAVGAAAYLMLINPATRPSAVSLPVAATFAVAPTEATATPEGFPNVALALADVRPGDGRSVAWIAIDNRSPRPYQAGEALTAGITLHKVGPDRVSLRYQNLSKTLFLDAGPATTVSNTAETAAKPVAWQERNLHIDPSLLHAASPRVAEEFLRYVEVLPHDGGGFFVNDVEPGSLYERLGLQSGDIIEGLESLTITDGGARPDTAEVRMEVFRDGQSVILTYHPQQ